MKSIIRLLRYIFFFIISIIIIALTFFTAEALKKTDKRNSNPELNTIKEGWDGNPMDNEGFYVNHEFPFNNDFTRLIKWQLDKNPQKDEKKSDTFRLKVRDANAFLNSKQDGIIWIGHSTFLIRMNGKLIITDPIFTVPSFFMKRFSKLPIKPESIQNLDFILVSHDHYDHLNKESIELLVKNNPGVKILAGLEVGKFMTDWLNGCQYQEAGWYQQYDITPDDITITYLPTRHWSSRGIGGVNNRLWGAFMIQSESYSIYFGGDSGYGSHFAEVNELFGAPDLAIIGIGAYKPEWFMGPAHTSPSDGLKGAVDMKATAILPMHYGTFDLSDEPIGEPYREIHRIHKEIYNDKIKLFTPDLGEIIKF